MNDNFSFITNFPKEKTLHFHAVMKLCRIKNYEIREVHDANLENYCSLWISNAEQWRGVLQAGLILVTNMRNFAIENGYATEDSPHDDFYYGMDLEEYKKQHFMRG